MSMWNKTAAGVPSYTTLDAHSANNDIIAVEGGWAHVKDYTDVHGNVRRKEEILVAMSADDFSAFADIAVGDVVRVYWTTEATPSAGGGADTATVTVEFTEEIAVTGTPQLTVVTDGAGGNEVLNYSSGSGTNELVFVTDALAGHTVGDILTITNTTSTIALNGGTVLDAAGSGTTSLTIATADIASGTGFGGAAGITFAA